MVFSKLHDVSRNVRSRPRFSRDTPFRRSRCAATVVKPRSTQMARKRKQGDDSAFSKLTPAQQRACLSFTRRRLRLTYEMNRQLQDETNLSLADYDVLNALRYEPEGRTQITALAIRIGWAPSRPSHHLRRVESREPV